MVGRDGGRGWHRDSRSHQHDGTIRTGSLCRVDHRHLEAAFGTKHLLQTAVAKSRVKPSYPVSALTVGVSGTSPISHISKLEAIESLS